VYGCVALVSGLSARLEAGTLLAAIEAIFVCRVSSADCLEVVARASGVLEGYG
jgi:hypothetical protein